jgi:hypothetical protein
VAHRDQEQPEVAHLGQQPVQSGLVCDRACDDGFVAVAADLEAKLNVPGLRPDLVLRPRLAERLDEGRGRGLVLICADWLRQDCPAGRVDPARPASSGVAVAGRR